MRAKPSLREQAARARQLAADPSQHNQAALIAVADRLTRAADKQKTAVPIPTEYELHLAAAKFLNHALTTDSHWFHSPLGGFRHASEAGRLKKMGATGGLPDIGVVYDGRIVWMELKREKRAYLSPAQAHCHKRLEAAGSPVSVCRNLDDLEAALKRAGIPLRARTA